MSPVNSFSPGTPLYNNLLMSVTAEISQDPIGPCRPLEQSEDSCKHSTMAALSSGLDVGDHSVVEYHNRGTMVGVRVGVRVRIMIRFGVTKRAEPIWG